MADCIFCAIAAGEAPADKLIDDERVCAFRDINPAAPVHVLVVPKDHIESLAHVGPDNTTLLAEVIDAVQHVAEIEGIAEDGYRVVTNVGRHGGMTVPHLHFHVLGGRPLRWPPE